MHHRSTKVAIIGAGPAGLLLSWSLRASGIDSIIVENRSQEYVLARIRAGVLEQGSVETFTKLGLGDRIATDGMVHNGIYLQAGTDRTNIDFHKEIGRTVTVYGQQEVVKDLVAAHERVGSEIYYEASDVAVHDVESEHPRVTFTLRGSGIDAANTGDVGNVAADGNSSAEEYEISADIIVGADGFHGVCRPSIPHLTTYERDYPYAWLGILANVAPSTDELIYALHEDGFAMHSMRSHTVSRLYLEVPPSELIADWSDERIWSELQKRLATPGWTLHEGEITEKSITPMRSFVASTLSHGRLHLVGDAGHIVPPTGAKGLNSAIADVTLLSDALVRFFGGSDAALAAYSDTALARQWKVQQFSQWMTEMLHRGTTASVGADPATGFDFRSQRGRIDYVTHSPYARQMLAEQYTGLEF